MMMNALHAHDLFATLGNGYNFLCSARPSIGASCLLDSNCGFCGDKFHSSYAAALAFACFTLISAAGTLKHAVCFNTC